MILVGTALGDSIDDGAGGAAVLGGIVGGVDLEFLDSGLGGGITNASSAAFFGKEGLIVVAAINGVVVQKSAHATETDQSEAAGIVDRARSEQREAGPAAAVNGQVFDGYLVDSGGKFLGVSVDLRGLRADHDSCASRTDVEARGNLRDATDLHDDLLGPEWSKALHFNGNGVRGGLELADAEIAGVIGHDGLFGVRTVVLDGDFGIWNGGAARIQHGAADGAVGGGLRECGASE